MEFFTTSDTQRIQNNNRKHNLTNQSKPQVELESVVINVDPNVFSLFMEVLAREFKLGTTESKQISISKR